jgi:tetratricopeptide (TPR) repeat protein
MAGILFLNGRYALAAKYYENAVELGEGGNCAALHADALMFSGKYKRSQEIFELFLQSKPDGHPEWNLKLEALRFIRQHLQFDEQHRKVDTAIKIFENCESFSGEEMSTAVTRALTSDALCGLAWFNQGVLFLKSTNRTDALLPFLIEALVNTWDVEAWCNAMALSIPSFRRNDFFMQILKTAYRFNGTRFIEQVIKFSKSQAKEFPSDQFVDLILQCLRELPEAEPQVVARLLKGDTDYEVIQLNTSERSSAIARTTSELDINSPKG